MRLHRGAVTSAGVGIAVLVIAAASMWHGAGGARVDEPAPMGSRVRVDVVGDSLVRQSSRILHRELSDGGFDFRVASEPGQALTSQVVRGHLDEVERSDAEVVVVATAANDAMERTTDGPDPSGVKFRERMAALVDRFRDRCVVIVNARTKVSPLYHPIGAAGLNRDLVMLAEQRDNVVLVDWDAESASLSTEAFAVDQLHFATDPAVPADASPSAAAYSHAIVTGVDRCAEQAIGSEAAAS